jgi:hypothetical protein
MALSKKIDKEITPSAGTTKEEVAQPQTNDMAPITNIWELAPSFNPPAVQLTDSNKVSAIIKDPQENSTITSSTTAMEDIVNEAITIQAINDIRRERINATHHDASTQATPYTAERLHQELFLIYSLLQPQTEKDNITMSNTAQGDITITPELIKESITWLASHLLPVHSQTEGCTP